MKKLALAAGVVLALVGCRALVGIDDLEFRPGPGQGPNGTSGGPDDADGGGRDKCMRDMDCRKCCKDSYEALRRTFEGNGAGVSCVCDPNAPCTAICADAGQVCGVPMAPDPDGGPNACAACVDDVLRRPGACNPSCNGDQGCMDGLSCIQNCP